MNIFGKTIIHLKEIGSTQDYAKKIAEKSKEGTIIVAERQIKGRGQFERKWISARGGLYFSLILKPKISPKEVSLITFKMSLAIVDVIRRIIGNKYAVFIKTPNDVVVRCKNKNKKIAGILTESSIKSGKIEWVVVGIGLNINNIPPKKLKDIAISVKQITKKNNIISEILINIISNFNKYCFEYSDSKLLATYKKNVDI